MVEIGNDIAGYIAPEVEITHEEMDENAWEDCEIAFDFRMVLRILNFIIHFL